MLVNVELVKFLRRLFNPAGLQRTLNEAGFPLDLQAYIEVQLKQSFPGSNVPGIMKYIQTNFSYFMTGDPVAVTKSINDYLLLDPYVIDFFGYPIFIYTDPKHLRDYALYGAGAFLIYKLLFKKRK